MENIIQSIITMPSIVKWMALLIVILIVNYISSILVPLIFRPFNIREGKKEALKLATRVVFIYLGFNYGLQLLELQTNSIVILIAAGAAAVVSLSSQNTIANIISGIITQGRHIFVRGDFINVAGVYGEVINWDLFSLQLKTVDNSVIIIPWAIIADSIVENNSTTILTPVEIIVPIPGEFDIYQAKEVILNVGELWQKHMVNNLTEDDLHTYNAVLKDCLYPYIVFRKVDSSSLNYHLFVLSNTQDDRELDKIHSDILMVCFNQLKERGMMPGQVSDVFNAGTLEINVNNALQ